MSHDINELSILKCLGKTVSDPLKPVLTFVNDDGSDERLSWWDIFENTNRMARILIQYGIGKGDTFTMILRNHPEFLYALFAALSLGAIAVPIDPRSKGKKLSFQILNTKSKGILAEDVFLENLREIQEDIKQVPVAGILYKNHHKIPVSKAYPILNEIMKAQEPDIPGQVVPLDHTACM